MFKEPNNAPSYRLILDGNQLLPLTTIRLNNKPVGEVGGHPAKPGSSPPHIPPFMAGHSPSLNPY
ncbi:MAG TPA: hypothetical protein VEC99_03385 [Clostridia bacterium]|nr:hypothetical protein [Clostridia bacterium]